jgi:hypothetical protein
MSEALKAILAARPDVKRVLLDCASVNFIDVSAGDSPFSGPKCCSWGEGGNRLPSGDVSQPCRSGDRIARTCCTAYARFWHKADILVALSNARFRG